MVEYQLGLKTAPFNCIPEVSSDDGHQHVTSAVRGLKQDPILTHRNKALLSVIKN